MEDVGNKNCGPLTPPSPRGGEGKGEGKRGLS